MSAKPKQCAKVMMPGLRRLLGAVSQSNCCDYA